MINNTTVWINVYIHLVMGLHMSKFVWCNYFNFAAILVSIKWEIIGVKLSSSLITPQYQSKIQYKLIMTENLSLCCHTPARCHLMHRLTDPGQTAATDAPACKDTTAATLFKKIVTVGLQCASMTLHLFVTSPVSPRSILSKLQGI